MKAEHLRKCAPLAEATATAASNKKFLQDISRTTHSRRTDGRSEAADDFYTLPANLVLRDSALAAGQDPLFVTAGDCDSQDVFRRSRVEADSNGFD